MSIDSIDDEFGRGFLARYFAGECSREDVRRFERWVAEQPEREELVDQLRTAWRLFGEMEQEPQAFDTQVAWAKLSGGMDSQVRPTQPPVLQLIVNRESSVARAVRRVAVAATLLLAVGAGSWLMLRERFTAAAAPAQLREVATRPGQRADVYLSDGTRVTLGAVSRLRFSAPLGKTSRDVYLEGEAVFEVTHDPKWPFLVRTAHAVTEDLGTRFGIRSYLADSVVSVAVAEGKVALRRDREPGTVLGPGDLGRLTADGRLETQRGAPLEPYLAWADGRLVFANTPLSEVLPQLARWHDLDVRVRGLSADTLFLTATFTTESTDELLRYIALVLDIRYERRGRAVTFHAK